MKILKCGACGTEGPESDFENVETGIKECKWCESDVWLNEMEIHEQDNR